MNTFRYLFLPIVGIVALIISWKWSEDMIALTKDGERTRGQITSVLKIRFEEGTYDLINQLDNDIVLYAKNGDYYEFTTKDYQATQVTYHLVGEEPITYEIDKPLLAELSDKIDEGREQIQRLLNYKAPKEEKSKQADEAEMTDASEEPFKDYVSASMTFETAAGDKYLYSLAENRPITITHTAPDGSKRLLFGDSELIKLVEVAAQGGLYEEFKREFERYKEDESASVRLVTMKKTETAYGWFMMNKRPVKFDYEGDIITAVYDEEGKPLDPQFTRMTTVGSVGEQLQMEETEDTEPQENNGEDAAVSTEPQIASYVDGEPYDFEAFKEKYRVSDFVLFQEGYFGELRPIAAFKHDGEYEHVVSKVGQVRRQMPAYELYKPVEVIYDAEDPQHAMVTYHPDALADAQEWIVYVSTAAAAIFSRWVYPFMFLIVGVTSLAGWLLYMSLTWYPHPEEGFHRKSTKKGKTNKNDDLMH